MAAPTFVQAYKGIVSIAGSNFNVLTAEATFTAPLDDITYTTSGGATFAVKIPGYVSGRGTIEFVYDTANQPTISPFTMVPGTLMVMILYPEGTKAYSFSAYSGEFNFRTGPQSTPGGASVRCRTAFETTGTITYPTS